MSHNPFYITTAIDYVNSLPHIGTAYEKIGADVLARHARQWGRDVHFQMGNDEHSLNVIKAAAERGMEPKAYCDTMRGEFERAWEKLEIRYDGFIQTSEEHHKKGVAKLFKLIEQNGDIYKSRYEGWYCESCEAYLTDKDLVSGACPHHRTKPAWLAQDNYFFKLSQYRDRLLEHIEANPAFIVPETRRNEIVSFLKEGLNDISVSRAGAGWGVPLPADPGHVVYVWFDALVNYVSAVGYGWDEDLFKKRWPADIHVIGKDIIRFHCIIWPAMLMSAGIPLPKTVLVHGFITSGGEKMSKSLGNVVRPMEVVDRYGADALRYYLLRQGPFSNDIDFTWDNFTSRYNGDLANGIGNLVSRTIGMADKYLGATIAPTAAHPLEALRNRTMAMYDDVHRALDHTLGGVEFNSALGAIWETMAFADRYINETKPWALAKQGKTDEIAATLSHVAEAIRHITILIFPFMPNTALSIWEMMGFAALGPLSEICIDTQPAWRGLPGSIIVRPGTGLFPRIEPEKKGAETRHPKKEKTMDTTATQSPARPQGTIDIIEIAEFAKVDLRVALILQAERVEGADKLLKIQADLGGGEQRQIVAGIAQHYEPDELIGKKIVVVANLKPAKLRGVESQGMLLAASDADTISILTPLKDVAVGSKVK